MLFNTVLALTALAVAAAQLQVNTPASLIVCQPAALSWTGGEAPFYLSVIPAGNPSAAPLKRFDEATSSPVTWTVDLAAGTNISIALTDKSGQPVYSSAVVILEGSSTSCLSAAGGSSASASGSGSAASASGSGSATPSASGSGSAASAAASPSGAAVKNTVLSAGFLGLLGVAVGVAA